MRSLCAMSDLGQCERERAMALVIDGDLRLRDSLAALLEQEGLQVVQLGSTAPLTDLVRQHRPDVILLDVLLDAASGLDALERLRKLHHKTPVIVLSAFATDDLLEAAVDAGADDFIAKPFSCAVLLAHVKAVLRRSRWQSAVG